MPEMPELEALRQVLAPALDSALVTACTVVPKKAHLLRYPVEEFEKEVPYRRFTRTWRRGKHLVFELELARGGELKDLLRNQAFLAGVGNAYSDEILFEACLLPLRRRATLKPDEEQALYEAIPTVLDRAVSAILGNPDYDESKQDRKFMKVHAK